MKLHVLKTCSDRESDRGCVVLDQPQHMGNGSILRLVCDTAAVLSTIAVVCTVTCFPAHAATQVGSAPYRVSATGAGNSYAPVFSADGRHIAFVSHANNLVTNDDLGPHLDLFVRDLVTSNTVLVSLSTNGFGGANDNIGLYTLSSNATVIAFDTAASNLLPWDNNRVSDIYVRDLVFGGTTRVTWSAGDEGDGNANGPSYNPLISEDGRYVIFESLASNLVTNDFNGTNDIFIHDLTTGVTELVSINSEGTASPDGPSHSPSISADGLTVAFVSHATNLVEGVTNTFGETYARRVVDQTTRWAVASHIDETRTRTYTNNTVVTSPYVASEPVLSSDGRLVLFKTPGSVLRFDITAPTNTLSLLVTNYGPLPSWIPPTGQPFWYSRFWFHDNPRPAGAPGSSRLSFTKDGRYAAFETVPADQNSPKGIKLVDFETLITNEWWHSSCEVYPERCPFPNYYAVTTNVQADSKVVLTNRYQFAGNQNLWTNLPWLQLDAAASQLLFVADASGLVAGETNRSFQIYQMDLSSPNVRLVSTNSSGQTLSDLARSIVSTPNTLSAVAFETANAGVADNDLNRAWDVFVRNADTGETQLISARHPELPAASGMAMSRLDLNPGAISANGRRLAILSLDNTLASNDTNNWRDLFVRDLVTGTNFDVSRSVGRVPFSSQTNFPGTNTAATPFLSADGRFVAFAGDALFFSTSTNRTIYWRDLEAPTNRIVVGGDQNNPAGVSLPVLSSSGRLVAFHSAGNHERFYSDGNSQSDVFVYLLGPHSPSMDCQISPFDRAPAFVSVEWNTTRTANGPSMNPVFTPDSASVLFQSRAMNLLSTPVSFQMNHQLYARGMWLTNILKPGCAVPDEGLAYSPTRLVSYAVTTSPGPFGGPLEVPLPGGGANPHFSADSRYVAFESGTNLIYRHDLLSDWVTNVISHPEPGFPSFTNRARAANDLVCSNCRNPSLDADGRFAAYEGLSMWRTTYDAFVKDIHSGQEELISVSLSGTNGNGSSSTPLISHDARFVVFASRANDLVPSDNNRVMDIFVRDRLNRVTHCLSRNFSGTGTGNRVSSNPILSADGRTVAFQSFASDLVPGDYNDTRDVFVATLGGPDTDGDHMDDDWEMAYFNTLARDGSGDFDNDGATDLAEFQAGTNPSNDTSILQVLRLTTAVAQVTGRRTTVLLWSAVPGKTYRVQFKRGLDDAWTSVGDDVTAASTSASLTDTVEAIDEPNHTHRFYRVLLVQ